MEVTDFIPERIHTKYFTFLVEITKCYICKRNMIERLKKPERVFPHWFKINFDAQVQKANLVIQSNVVVDDHYICKECVRAGKADFLCALCKTRKPANKIEDSFGDPPEFLCTDCFNTVTAVVWHKMTENLYENHKYDSSY